VPGPTTRPRNPLGTVLDLLHRPEVLASGLGVMSPPNLRERGPSHAPDGAAFLTRNHACAAGSRDYRLYVPSGRSGHARALVVMLHGCTQTPDDFAAGTGMNELAEEHRFVVAYPRQAASANHTGCWNWFNPEDQARDLGEPSIIAGLTRTLVHEFDIDEARVFVAGLSAGGAMSAILATTYPDLYRAVGIHSGLAYGAASDLVSAFAAMRGTPLPSGARQKRPLSQSEHFTRTIVFHGTSDQTVHPSNGEAIFASARGRLNGAAETKQHGRSPGGLAYTRKVVTNPNGHPQLEHWLIDGMGHAWSGGRPAGSYTDLLGPDASREMVRFFLAAEPIET
jgi:poly(hydroxyalkanoate) depolymerase family esterase